MQNIKKRRIKIFKTFFQKALEKAAPAVEDYIGSKIADKLTSRIPQKIEEEQEEMIIPSDKRQQILNDLRLF